MVGHTFLFLPADLRDKRVGFLAIFLPVLGLSSRESWLSAWVSYSRRPQISQTQAGKSGTLISSSPIQVK